MSRRLPYRLLQAALVLLIMSLVIYGLMGLMPGDPVDVMIATNPKLTPADAERLRALYGLDQPLARRYLNWLAMAARGDLGFSRLAGRPVVEVMAQPLGNTALLMSLSLLAALLVALPIGVAAALRPDSLLDRTVNLLAFAGISMPVFWLGLMLIAGFAVVLGVLPAGGVHSVGGGGTADRLRHLALPVATLAVASIGQYVRHMRAAMIETLRNDYVRTARAKGAGWARVVIHHALRNALIPVVTIVALDFGALFSGALITETVFAYPGMGRLIFDSIMGNDFNMALAALLLATLLTLLGNLLADAAYAWLDPRIGDR